MPTADIQIYEADVAAFAQEIVENDEDIPARVAENADYVITHKDYSESIDALTRVIIVLKKQNFDRKQAMSVLMQVKYGALIPKEQCRIIAAFLQQDPASSSAASHAASAPEAIASQFQSHGIIDMLPKLLDKFDAERVTLVKEETTSRHALEMLLQALKASIEQATAVQAEKSESKGKVKKLQAAADAHADLDDTTTPIEDDTRYLADLTATCEQKVSNFESRQPLRGEEIEMFEQAIDTISGAKPPGTAEKHLHVWMQVKSSSFLQLRSDNMNPNQLRVVTCLKDHGREIDNRVLGLVDFHDNTLEDDH